MKYRIKITTFANGRKEYRAYVKSGLFWKGMWPDGKADFSYTYVFRWREDALEAIDLNFAGNRKKKHIDFEYITK